MEPEVAAELHRINLVGYMLNVIRMRSAEIEPWLDANTPGWRTAPAPVVGGAVVESDEDINE